MNTNTRTIIEQANNAISNALHLSAVLGALPFDGDEVQKTIASLELALNCIRRACDECIHCGAEWSMPYINAIRNSCDLARANLGNAETSIHELAGIIRFAFGIK